MMMIMIICEHYDINLSFFCNWNLFIAWVIMID